MECLSRAVPLAAQARGLHAQGGEPAGVSSTSGLARSAAFGAGAGASASSSSASKCALPAAVPSSSDMHSLAVLAAARLAAAGQKPSGQSARVAAYEEEWALYKEGLNKVIASLA